MEENQRKIDEQQKKMVNLIPHTNVFFNDFNCLNSRPRTGWRWSRTNVNWTRRSRSWRRRRTREWSRSRKWFWEKTTPGQNFPSVLQIQSNASFHTFLDSLGFSTIALEIHSFDTDRGEVLIKYFRGSFKLFRQWQNPWPNKPFVNWNAYFYWFCNAQLIKLLIMRDPVD